LIRAKRGEGAFVEAVPERQLSGVEDQVDDLLRSAFSYATLAGLSSERLRRLVERQLQGITQRQIPVAFVECNPYEAKEIALRMQHALGHPVVPMVIDKLPPTSTLTRDFPVISTTLFHLSELQHKLKRRAVRIVGLQHSPSTESVLEIARLPRGTSIGVVASNQRTLNVLLKLVETYHESVVGTCFTSDPSHVQALAGRAEVLVVHPLAKRSMPDDLSARVIEVTFQIEPQSLDYLRQHISRLSARGGRGPGARRVKGASAARAS
jgi:hypothetical protein